MKRKLSNHGIITQIQRMRSAVFGWLVGSSSNWWGSRGASNLMVKIPSKPLAIQSFWREMISLTDDQLG